MVMAIYRLPGQSAINFLADFTDWLTENLLQDCNPIILGDFNLHLHDINSDDAMNLQDTMDALGLIQHVNFVTHPSSNILDHIYMEEASSVKIDQCIQSEYISHHRIIECKTTLEKEPIVNQEVLYCDVNSIIIEDFMDDLLFDYGNTPTLQAVVDGFNKSLLEAFDKHAPLVTKKIPVR